MFVQTIKVNNPSYQNNITKDSTNTGSSFGSFIFWFLFFVFIIIAIIIIIRKIIKSSRASGIDKHYFKNKWEEIEKAMSMNSDMGYKMAIIEADKLFDSALKKLYIAGSTMGERLKVICYKYPNLRQVWKAHFIRNNISHDSDYKLYASSARKAIDMYKNGLKEIGIL